MNTHFNLDIQLPAFWQLQKADKNIKSHHVTLYISLLLKWQKQENNPVILIKSYEMMDESNLGSRTTYYRSMKELLKWGYISGYRKVINGAIVEMKFLHFPTDRQVVSLPRTKLVVVR